MNIEDLTLKQIREIQAMLPATIQLPQPYPIALGAVVCVQTVTLWYVGTLQSVTPTDIVLVDAAWAADTGRFSEFVATGEAREVEPLPAGLPVVISRGAVVCVIPHPKQLRVLK
jgi:hypothetical protein